MTGGNSWHLHTFVGGSSTSNIYDGVGNNFGAYWTPGMWYGVIHAYNGHWYLNNLSA